MNRNYSRQTNEIMAIFLRENHVGRSPKFFSEGISIIPEFGGNHVFVSLGELNLSSILSAERLPQYMGFYSRLHFFSSFLFTFHFTLFPVFFKKK